jgi:hypothetical protein
MPVYLLYHLQFATNYSICFCTEGPTVQAISFHLCRIWPNFATDPPTNFLNLNDLYSSCTDDQSCVSSIAHNLQVARMDQETKYTQNGC